MEILIASSFSVEFRRQRWRRFPSRAKPTRWEKFREIPRESETRRLIRRSLGIRGRIEKMRLLGCWILQTANLPSSDQYSMHRDRSIILSREQSRAARRFEKLTEKGENMARWIKRSFLEQAFSFKREYIFLACILLSAYNQCCSDSRFDSRTWKLGGTRENSRQ